MMSSGRVSGDLPSGGAGRYSGQEWPRFGTIGSPDVGVHSPSCLDRLKTGRTFLR
jgi:hypothetical protein